MKLTEQEVRHVAELANLALRDDEIAKMTHDLDGILTHIDKLNELDTSDVSPMVSTLNAASGGDPTSALRDDVERPTLGNKDALANAPLAGSGYFKVPKVIER
jgi:aspartyl-tRNA(Asn)/glutamyl-tRNA(Gln) amidotransferase subunit C